MFQSPSSFWNLPNIWSKGMFHRYLKKWVFRFLDWNAQYMSIKFLKYNVSFKTSVSLLNFCPCLDISFLCECLLVPAVFAEETVFAPLYYLCYFVKDQLTWCEFISGLSVLFHWSSCPFFHQYHTVLITATLK